MGILLTTQVQYGVISVFLGAKWNQTNKNDDWINKLMVYQEHSI